MFGQFARAALVFAAPLLMLFLTTPVQAQLDPSVLSTLNYAQMQWNEDKRPTNPGSWYTVLSGDLSRPGPFVILNKVLRGNFNQPHFHLHDRQIYVVSGTWWIGVGPNQNPAGSVATPAGNYVKQLGNQVHWDGAKDEDVLLMIAGEGPAIDDFVK
jgi:hypothetical protein